MRPAHGRIGGKKQFAGQEMHSDTLVKSVHQLQALKTLRSGPNSLPDCIFRHKRLPVTGPFSARVRCAGPANVAESATRNVYRRKDAPLFALADQSVESLALAFVAQAGELLMFRGGY
jgi:hypothetical protein